LTVATLSSVPAARGESVHSGGVRWFPVDGAGENKRPDGSGLSPKVNGGIYSAASFAANLYATNTHSVVISAVLPVAESTSSTVAMKGARSRLTSNCFSVANLTDILARATVTPPRKPG
jgi:hypothetical protein